MMSHAVIAVSGLLLTAIEPISSLSEKATLDRYEGVHFSGTGDVEYIRLLDIARRMFEPDPVYQNVAMLYTPQWNGFVEGPTWNAWWIQNSYGTTYGALPFLEEPYLTFLQNAQDLWFDQMGDGKRAGDRGLVAPDGCLCDAAAPGIIFYKQGDGRVDIHDWGFEFTAAGLLMQAELLLISREPDAIAHYLPKLERCAEFIDSRRDPNTNLFLVGPAANLLAPSFAGWRQPDGSFEKAYLAGLSVTYIAALERLIELEKLAGRPEKAAEYAERQQRVRRGLPLVTEPEGYFIKSLDPDGTRHGVFGAAKHGYFEASPNHDAIAFRVVDDEQAKKIYNKIVSIPELRRHTVIIANEPSLDDMYESPDKSIWVHGHWVNGGHWSTCEGRMILAYFRLGQYDDARRSFEHILTFARRFRMDNPLTDFGNNVYQPHKPINICYDTFAPAAAMIRGLFEFLYCADGVTLIPHIPSGITSLELHDPFRLGEKRLFLSVYGTGPITDVRINKKKWQQFTADSVTLPYADIPATARVMILRSEAKPSRSTKKTTPLAEKRVQRAKRLIENAPAYAAAYPNLTPLLELAPHALKHYETYFNKPTQSPYLAAHARVVLEAVVAAFERADMQAKNLLPPLPPESQQAADQSYIDTAVHLYEGLTAVIEKTKK